MHPGKLSNIFRIGNWWDFIIPPILGFTYMVIYLTKIEFITAGKNLLMFFVMIIGTAAFGFFYNDFTDIDFDKKAGKTNFASRFSPINRILIILLTLLIAIAPSYYLPLSKITIILLATQFILLILYSNPLTRLKNHIYAGVVSDALYSNLIFILFGIFTFILLSENKIHNFNLLIFLITIAVFFKGLRNILLHQISDRKKDIKAGQSTFASKKGGLYTIHLINRIILPVEGLFLILFSVFSAYLLNSFFLLPLLFILFTISKFRFWEKLRLSKRNYKFMFLSLPNDFYEEWLPFFFLVLLTISEPVFGIILIIHLVLFFATIKKFTGDLVNIVKNYIKDFKAFKKKVLHI